MVANISAIDDLRAMCLNAPGLRNWRIAKQGCGSTWPRSPGLVGALVERGSELLRDLRRSDHVGVVQCEYQGGLVDPGIAAGFVPSDEASRQSKVLVVLLEQRHRVGERLLPGDGSRGQGSGGLLRALGFGGEWLEGFGHEGWVRARLAALRREGLGVGAGRLRLRLTRASVRQASESRAVST
jgi:hypothetical protein